MNKRQKKKLRSKQIKMWEQEPKNKFEPQEYITRMQRQNKKNSKFKMSSELMKLLENL